MELDLTEAIESAREEMAALHLGDEHDRRYTADAAVRAAAPIIEREVRGHHLELMWKQVGWISPVVGPDGFSTYQMFEEGRQRPGPNWRRVYVMLTAQERAAMHNAEPADA